MTGFCVTIDFDQVPSVYTRAHSKSRFLKKPEVKMKFANMQATSYNDKVVRQFAIMTVVWGVVS